MANMSKNTSSDYVVQRAEDSNNRNNTKLIGGIGKGIQAAGNIVGKANPLIGGLMSGVGTVFAGSADSVEKKNALDVDNAHASANAFESDSSFNNFEAGEFDYAAENKKMFKDAATTAGTTLAAQSISKMGSMPSDSDLMTKTQKMDISSELPNAPEGTTTGDIFSGNELQLPEQDNIFGGTEIGELGNSSSSDFMGEEVDEMNLQMEFAKEMGIDNSNLTGVEADEFKANFEVWLNKKNGGK
jgi:hypothetical protein